MKKVYLMGGGGGTTKKREDQGRSGSVIIQPLKINEGAIVNVKSSEEGFIEDNNK
jgi:hypothetical protein